MQIGTSNVLFWDFGCGERETGAPDAEIDPAVNPLIDRGYALPGSGSRCRKGAKAVDGCGKCGGLDAGAVHSHRRVFVRESSVLSSQDESQAN
jgi:hypothetical protein